ncbi:MULTISPECIES: response regulator [Deinococcus]|uniref:Response regulator n=1 Tax=Deinococcus rufus TaxID=2136097 RepID=A0ABV7ZBG7_9DEIO|nr:response regulator [Deinococcus sp. AB2017081]WQE97344.1 response regulator [Deinococcus sp. AB2017081]
MTRPFHVLLIDDNATDLLLATEAFLELDATVGVDTFASGQHALDHLRATPQDALPDVIILDINMPVLNGFDVLSQLKDDPALQLIPVVMLSTSDYLGDVTRAYSMHASSYLIKSRSFTEFVQQVDAFLVYWRSVILARQADSPQ